MDLKNISSKLAQDFARQLEEDFEERQRKIRASLTELAQIELEITRARAEAADAKQACHEATCCAAQERTEAVQAAQKVKQELALAQALLSDARAKYAAETSAHKAQIGVLKAQYKAAEKEGRDAVARLAVARDAIRAETRALLEKLKGLV